MAARVRCAVIGQGTTGIDLLRALKRSELLEPAWMAGIDPTSEGLSRARAMGLMTTAEGVEGLLPHVAEDDIRIAFDTSSAYCHPENARKLNPLGVVLIDLTPAGSGPYCVPSINLEAQLGGRAMNFNMVSCSGQAAIPLIHAVSRVQNVAHAEIAATIPGDRLVETARGKLADIIRATTDAIVSVGGAVEGKAIVHHDPAASPPRMRAEIRCTTQAVPDIPAITASIEAMARDVEAYIPGFTLAEGPVFEGKRVTAAMEIDRPADSGRLGVMAAASAATAERIAERMLRRQW